MPTKIEESIIRKCLKSEISTVVAIIVAVVATLGWFSAAPNSNKDLIVELQKNQIAMGKDLEVINTNHLTHIQSAIEKLEANSDQNIKDHNEIDKKLERILTILEQ